MDLLLKEMQRKKEGLAKAKQAAMAKANDNDNGDDSRKRKYIRRGDLRRMEEEEEDERQRQRHLAVLSSKRPKTSIATTTTTTTDAGSDHKTKKKKKKKKATNDNNELQEASASKSPDDLTTTTATTTTTLSATSITERLRAFGLPIRYFGETQELRVQRLQKASEQQTHVLQGLSEMEEFRLGKGHGIRNPFLGSDKTTKANNQPPSQQRKEKQKEEEEEDDDHKKKKEEEEEEDDPPKRIYKYFKGLLKEWEQDLSERPDSAAQTVAGRNESKTLKQCKDYVRPLFKLLKQRKIEAGLQAHLLEIVSFAQQGEFVRAHDSYINVAIGRAAWPIGVTMVGIHARSGRAKIATSNVAHVMNSELQRKYLTSVKRLLTYAQKKRPDVDPSKKVA
jgi:pre-mRNA-splicing factor 18